MTKPPALTFATDSFDDDHVIVRCVSGAPLASTGVAVSCNVSPTTSAECVAVTLTDSTFAVADVGSAVHEERNARTKHARPIARDAGIIRDLSQQLALCGQR